MSTGTVQVFIAALHIALAAGVTAHIVLTKNDVRSAIGWVGLVWLTPVLGSVLYMFFGVNRIRRRAVQLRGHRSEVTATRALPERRGIGRGIVAANELGFGPLA